MSPKLAAVTVIGRHLIPMIRASACAGGSRGGQSPSALDLSSPTHLASAAYSRLPRREPVPAGPHPARSAISPGDLGFVRSGESPGSGDDLSQIGRASCLERQLI